MFETIRLFLKDFFKETLALGAYYLGKKRAREEVEFEASKIEKEAIKNAFGKTEEIRKKYSTLRSLTPNDWNELRRKNGISKPKAS